MVLTSAFVASNIGHTFSGDVGSRHTTLKTDVVLLEKSFPLLYRLLTKSKALLQGVRLVVDRTRPVEILIRGWCVRSICIVH